MNYFDLEPEDLPQIPKYELRAWRELVKFMKDVHAKVFTDPPARSQLSREVFERYFPFAWHRPPQPDSSEPAADPGFEP